MKLSKVLCFTSIFVASTGAAFAADMAVKARPAAVPVWVNPILVANNQISLDAVGHHLDYHEWTPAYPVFNSEKNWQPGLQVTGSAMGNLGAITNIYVMGQYTYISGKSDYWAPGGPLGPNTPVSMKNGAKFNDFDFRLGKGFEAGQNWMFTPYLGVGYSIWDRDLSNDLGPFGYHEKYEYGYAGAGLLIQYAPTQQIVLSGYGLVGSTFDPKMTTSYNGGFAVLPWTYGLGTSAIYKAGIAADFALTRQWHFNVGADYTNFRFGASAQAPNGSYEPDSETHRWTVKAGLGYSFYAPPAVVAKY
jgi:hypothetical protein